MQRTHGWKGAAASLKRGDGNLAECLIEHGHMDLAGIAPQSEQDQMALGEMLG
jgi:hypothetical protein